MEFRAAAISAAFSAICWSRSASAAIWLLYSDCMAERAAATSDAELLISFRFENDTLRCRLIVDAGVVAYRHCPTPPLKLEFTCLCAGLHCSITIRGVPSDKCRWYNVDKVNRAVDYHDVLIEVIDV